MRYIYNNYPEKLSKLFAVASLLECGYSSVKELERSITASVDIVNDTTGKYSEFTRELAQNIVRFAMAGGLVSRLDGVGSASKTVLRTTPKV